MDDGIQNNPKNVVMPFINQLKYSGVYVPDELVQAFYINKGIGYYTANLTVLKNREVFERADQLMDNLLNYLSLSNKE
jgi:predicted small integral membrane protein